MTDETPQRPWMTFEIEGREYPLPGMDSLTMGERRVMYDLCGLVQEDFTPLENETETEYDERTRAQRRHPGFMQAMMHIAYQRGNPQTKASKVAEIVERTEFTTAIEAWAESVRGAEPPAPLELTSSPNEQYSSDKDGKSDVSGASSESGSEGRDVTLLATGTGR